MSYEKVKSRYFRLFTEKYLTYFSAFVLSVIVISCADDPVTPPKNNQTIDTLDSLFNWQYLNTPGYFIIDMYVYDTNNVFLGLPYGIMTVHGNNFSVVPVTDTNFYVKKIKGFNTSTIFVGGGTAWGNYTRSKLKTWDGSVFTDIYISQDSTNGIEDILVKSPTDVWLATYSKVTYHYDGISINSYDLLERNEYPVLFADSVGNIYLFGPSANGSVTGIFYSYQFNGSGWQVLLSEPYDTTTNLQPVVYTNGKSVFRPAKDGIYRFTGTGWSLLFNTPGLTTSIPGGGSINDIMFNGRRSDIPVGFNYIYYYNGYGFYKQSNYFNHNAGSQLYGITKNENNFYGYYQPQYSSDSYLVIGRKKP